MSQYSKLLYLSSLCFLCGMIGGTHSLFAQHADNIHADNIEGYLNYPLNKSFVVYDFANNVNEINSLHSYITKTLNDPTFAITRVEVTGYSSPEGSYEHNEKLAQERAENLKNYLRPFFSEQEIQTNYVPEDWEGLVHALAQASHPELERIQAIAQAGYSPADKEKELKALPQRTYKDLCRNYFPLLRRATLTMHCERRSIEDPTEPATLTNPTAETPGEQEQYVQAQQKGQYIRTAAMHRRNVQTAALADRYGRRYYASGRRRSLPGILAYDMPTPTLAIGINLLQWAGFRPDFTHTTTIPNIYVEYYFLKRWSVKGAFAYGNWSYDDGKRFQGISSYSIEPRFWLKNDETFRGFFVGIYGQAGDYNQKDNEQNHTGKYYSGGVSAGYLLPIYRGLAVEVSLRGGYRHATVKKYKSGEDCNNLCRKYTKKEFTVTGSCLSLVYRF